MKKARKVLVVIVILNIYLSTVSWADITSATMETADLQIYSSTYTVDCSS